MLPEIESIYPVEGWRSPTHKGPVARVSVRCGGVTANGLPIWKSPTGVLSLGKATESYTDKKGADRTRVTGCVSETVWAQIKSEVIGRLLASDEPQEACPI